MPRYLSTDPNAGLSSGPRYLSTDPHAGDDAPEEKPGAASRFASGVGRGVIGGLEGLAGAVLHPIDTATEIVAQPVRQIQKAGAEVGRGNYLRAAADLGGAVPLVGGMALDLGERTADTGDVAGAAGEIVGNIALGKGLAKAPKALRRGVPMVGDAASVMGGEMAGALPTAGAAEVIASGVGLGGGAAAGAVLTYKALRAIPKVFEAVKAGIMKREGISGAAAELTMIEMPPETLAQTVKEVAPKVYDETLKSHSPAVSPERAALKAANSARIEAERQAYWEKHPKPAEAAPARVEPLPAAEVTLPKGEGPYPELTPEQLAQIERDLAPGGKFGPGRSGAEPAPVEPAPVRIRSVHRHGPARESVLDRGQRSEAAPEVRGGNPNIVDGEGRPIADWTPERAREAVANLPWNREATMRAKAAAEKAERPREMVDITPEKAREIVKPETFIADRPGKVTIQPELADRIGKAVSPQAAFEDLKRHGAGDGKPLPASAAREMVDMVWKELDPGYKSIEQWMMERRDKWDAMRQASPSSRSGNQGLGADLAAALAEDGKVPAPKPASDLVGSRVKWKIPSVAGTKTVSGQVLSVAEDGTLEVRTVQDGYLKVNSRDVQPFESSAPDPVASAPPEPVAPTAKARKPRAPKPAKVETVQAAPEPPVEASAKVSDHIERVIETEGVKAASEIHRRVLAALDEELKAVEPNAPKIEYRAHGTYSGKPHGTVYATVGEETMNFDVQHGALRWSKYGDKKGEHVMSFDRNATHAQIKPQAELAISKLLGEGKQIKLKIPGDGNFTIERTPAAIRATIQRIKAGGPVLWNNIAKKGKK